MKHFLIWAGRLFPIWVGGFLLALGQLTLHYKRRENRLQYGLIAIGAVFLLLLVAWFWFRGDVNSDRWMRAFVDIFE